MSKIFSWNHATNCVHHNKQNVKTWFGLNAAEMVFPIATTFVQSKKNHYWSSKKTNQLVHMTIWKNSNGAMAQYTMDYNTEITTATVILPPWYGVVTSNTSECIIQ